MLVTTGTTEATLADFEAAAWRSYGDYVSPLPKARLRTLR